MINTRLLESINIVTAFPPADLDTDRVGDWVSLKNYDGCLIVIHKAAGSAGDDMSILLEQATDVSGTSAKALNVTHLYAKIGATALTATSQFTKYTGSATNDIDTVSVFGTDVAGDSNEACFVLDIRASDLDVSGGFDCLRWSSEGDDLGAAAIGASFYLLYGARYPQAIPLGSITD
jgi:hypothetical protein